MNDKTLAAEPEPAARQFQGRDGVWHNFIDERHFQNTVANGSWPIRNLYTQEAIDTLRAQLAEAQKERDKAIDLLETMFSSYENGTACYEDPEDCSGFVGYAFKMDDLDFNACCDLLNRTRPRTAIDAAKGGPS